MHHYLVEMLECPACHAGLGWVIQEYSGNRIETAEATCNACGASYPVRDGIGLFLTPDLPRNDLWEQQGSWLIQHLHEHPAVEQQLMGVPLETLAPADQLFRAMVLDDRGEYDQAKTASDLAMPGIYTPELLSSSADQISFAIEHLGAADGPIVDLASGGGTLVQEMASRLSRPIVATDFSPKVLRRDRCRWESLGLYDRVSLLAFDARRTPFKDGAVGTLTTYQGLPNITEPGDLLQELRRVVGGVFLAITIFYPEEDDANTQMIRELQLEELLFRARALECFTTAGWQVEIVNSRTVKASPTPRSALLGGAGIDGLPVTDTMLEVCICMAR